MFGICPLCPAFWSVLLLFTSALPRGQNEMDNIFPHENKKVGLPLYQEPIILTEDVEFFEYVKENSPRADEHHAKQPRDKEHVTDGVGKGHNHSSTEGPDSMQKNLLKKLNSPLKKRLSCGPANFAICSGLGPYSPPQHPNMFDDVNGHEVLNALRPYLSIMTDRSCANALKKFLCLLLAPQCTGTDELLSPCLSVCRSAKQGCWQALKHAGMEWPKTWECDQFPNDGVCADLESYVKPVPEPLTKANQRKHSIQISNDVIQIKHDKHRPSIQQQPSTNNVKLSRKPTKIRELKPRRYDIRQLGRPDMFQGWADVQGQGSANDYCRVIGTNVHQYFLSCTLGGSSEPDHHYVSKRGFDAGHEHTWFMRDMDGDGRDDYCRCVGRGIKSVVSCMKAGAHGFWGSPQQTGNEYTFTVHTSGPCFQRKINSFIGV